jgi:hypothetical protein
LPTVRIPRTNDDRRQQTYAQLIQRVNRRGPIPFEGRLLRTGSKIEEADLRPDTEWPETPLLIEYAGNDRSGRGHIRSRDIHVLWKFQNHEWIELSRATSHGPEWWYHLKPAVLRELSMPEVNYVELAGKASERVLELLDRELDQLPPGEGRERALSFIYDQFSARMVSQAA